MTARLGETLGLPRKDGLDPQLAREVKPHKRDIPEIQGLGKTTDRYLATPW